VVGTNDVPERRTVKLGPLVDGLRVVRSGIGPDDWVVIRGQQRLQPDQKIIPKRTPLTVSDAHNDSVTANKP
jgi:multidrug efflux system membrane fusion protein